MEIKIRKAMMKDLKDIQKLNHQLCIKENREFDSTINKNYPMQQSGMKYFRLRIKDKNSCALIASFDGKTAGYLIGSIIEKESYRLALKLAEVEGMFVVEDLRSNGIGKKLLHEFFKWCRTRKIMRIKVVASAQNDGAIEFYRREGFEDYNLVLEKEIK